MDAHTGALRRRVLREWLIQTLSAPTQATEKILETFARARLLTFDTTSVEITHEALLHAWPRLTDWISADRAGLRIHHLLSETAEAWEADDRDPSLLYRGSRLAIAHDWATSPGHQDQISGLEAAYLQASTEQKHHEQHAQRRRTRHLRTLVGVLAISLVVVLLAGSIALQQYYDADEQGRTASATELAATSYLVAARHPDVAMLLAVEAYHQAKTPMTSGALLSAQSQYFAGQLTGHTDTITKAVFSLDGRTLATASADHTIRLWNVTSHRPIVKIEIPGPIHDVEFNPDGHTLAIASDNQTVRLWDVSNPGCR
ncbi:MAG: WD40 repeat domain-containing protein [Pseudonocardiaceae bacterium]